MKKGLINITVVFIIIVGIVITLLAFIETLNKFSDFNRYFVFWQGYYLADSYIVKLYTDNPGELIVKNVPYSSSEAVQEIGKSYIDTYIYGSPKISSTNIFKYTTRVKVSYSNGKIVDYKIIGKYTE